MNPSITAVTMEPMIHARMYRKGLPTVANTKIPPWGAISVHPKNALNPPAMPAPTSVQGITCTGSLAAKGIAPSVMKEHPITRLDTRESRSAAVNFFGKNWHARAIPMGGTIPPTMMEAMAM